jgi:hypothetical protein
VQRNTIESDPADHYLAGRGIFSEVAVAKIGSGPVSNPHFDSEERTSNRHDFLTDCLREQGLPAQLAASIGGDRVLLTRLAGFGSYREVVGKKRDPKGRSQSSCKDVRSAETIGTRNVDLTLLAQFPEELGF